MTCDAVARKAPSKGYLGGFSVWKAYTSRTFLILADLAVGLRDLTRPMFGGVCGCCGGCVFCRCRLWAKANVGLVAGFWPCRRGVPSAPNPAYHPLPNPDCHHPHAPRREKQRAMILATIWQWTRKLDGGKSAWLRPTWRRCRSTSWASLRPNGAGSARPPPS